MSTTRRQLPAQASEFRRALGAWFDASQRPLPWRTKRSLYRTVISEFMLQQTQVATVLPYFQRWMRELPDFAALASANEARVLKLWEGLGYYRRVRFLHRLARELAVRPTPPTTAADWCELPGVGPYTAAAIASLTFNDRATCVDGNVVRILARLTATKRTFASGSKAVRYFEKLAATLLDPKQPGRHNEAMMELGATVCVRRNPRCDACPVARFCAARSTGQDLVNALPRIERTATVSRTVDRIWLVRDGALLLHRTPFARGRLTGLLELPEASMLRLGADALASCQLLAKRRRAITHHQITERIHRLDDARVPSGDCENGELQWVALDRLDTVTLSGPHRRWVTGLLMNEAVPSSSPARGGRDPAAPAAGYVATRSRNSATGRGRASR